MPLLRLIAEGVGPFEKLDIDFSDGHGEPHLGPHILAGVNGSGKSTILRTIAWTFDRTKYGFQYDEWMQALKGYPRSRALVALKRMRRAPSDYPFAPNLFACSTGVAMAVSQELLEWVRGSVSERSFDQRVLNATERLAPTVSSAAVSFGDPPSTWLNVHADDGEMSIIAAYSPSKALRYLANPDLTKRLSYHDASCLAFDTTVHNEAIQAWLLSLYSKRAIARDRSQSGDEYSKPLERLESALRSLYDQDVSFEVEIERAFQLRLKFRGHSLDFSQLPDGVRSTLAWIADFMMRQDLIPWANFGLLNKRPGILLLDEADAHLHPHWQRRLLPAVRAALPDVQIIVTSHSPFVISSCPGSRVHVLEVDGEGRACAKAPVDSPIGESVTTTLKEIFGVDSRFDVLTERELNRWNDLKKAEAMDSLSPPEKAELDQLTITLGERSEELRSIVSAQSNASKLVLESLTTKRKRRVS